MHESGRPAELAAPEAPAAPPRRRFSGAEWDRLVREGFFRPEERLELIDGEVRVISPIGDPHATFVQTLANALRRAYGASHSVREEKPLEVGEDRLYPDVVVVPGPPWAHLERSPSPRQAPLLCEVSDSTLGYDLGEKAAIYAAGGAREYWVLDIQAAELVIHRDPRRRRKLGQLATWGAVVRLARGRVRAPGAARTVAVREVLRRP